MHRARAIETTRELQLRADMELCACVIDRRYGTKKQNEA